MKKRKEVEALRDEAQALALVALQKALFPHGDPCVVPGPLGFESSYLARAAYHTGEANAYARLLFDWPEKS